MKCLTSSWISPCMPRFISEVRREDGEEYPGKTLYEMLGSIQTFLRVKCKRNVTLLQGGCNIKNIAVQSVHCNIARFSSFRITPDNFPANKKDRLRFLQKI